MSGVNYSNNVRGQLFKCQGPTFKSQSLYKLETITIERAAALYAAMDTYIANEVDVYYTRVFSTKMSSKWLDSIKIASTAVTNFHKPAPENSINGCNQLS